MRSLLLLCCILGITGCDKLVTPTGVNSSEALTRYIDKENGVVCYQSLAKQDAFSCVKVR